MALESPCPLRAHWGVPCVPLHQQHLGGHLTPRPNSRPAAEAGTLYVHTGIGDSQIGLHIRVSRKS